MALDPRLSLMVQGSDVNNFFSGAQQGQNLMNMPLQNELLQQKVMQGQEQIGLAPMRREALQQQLDQGQNTLATQQQDIDKGNLEREIFGARKLVSAINSKDERGAINTIIDTFPDPARQAQELAEFRADPMGYGRDAQAGIAAFDAQRTGTKSGLVSAKTEILKDGTRITQRPDGSTQVTNPEGIPVSGKARVDALEKSTKFGLSLAQKESDIKVTQARKVAAATSREGRISDFRKEISNASRESARTEVKLEQALKLAENADQGLKGAAKLQLAKLFPGIDVSNEAALDQGLTELALVQLQAFKGPTTDFEYDKAASTVGAVGDSKSANISRLNGLKRNNWFVKREADQFIKYTKAGGDPDSFSFNFGEPIKTGRGVFTLRQLQDTAVSNNISIDDVLKKLGK